MSSLDFQLLSALTPHCSRPVGLWRLINLMVNQLILASWLPEFSGVLLTEFPPSTSWPLPLDLRFSPNPLLPGCPSQQRQCCSPSYSGPNPTLSSSSLLSSGPSAHPTGAPPKTGGAPNPAPGPRCFQPGQATALCPWHWEGSQLTSSLPPAHPPQTRPLLSHISGPKRLYAEREGGRERVGERASKCRKMPGKGTEPFVLFLQLSRKPDLFQRKELKITPQSTNSLCERVVSRGQRGLPLPPGT